MRSAGTSEHRLTRTPAGGVARHALTVIAGALVLVCLALLAVVVTQVVPTAHADGGAFDIVVPTASANVSSGPVGSYVSINGTGQPNDTYAVGYATQDAGCVSGFTALASGASTTADPTGAVGTTFTWPTNGASAVGSAYYVCLQDTTTPANPVLQSNELFRVVASAAPSITVQLAPNSSPSTAPSGGPNSYYAGSTIQVAGKHFQPGGTTIEFYLNGSATVTPGDLTPPTQLIPSSGTLTSSSNGTFTTDLVLPTGKIGSSWYLHVVSADGSNFYVPSQQATQQVTIVLAPSATATPAASRQPGATSTASKSGGGTPPAGAPPPGSLPHNSAAVFALAGLSVLLFVVGVLLLASALASPRSRA